MWVLGQCGLHASQTYSRIDRYMYEKLSERSDGTHSPTLRTTVVKVFPFIGKVLDERIDDMAEIVRLHYNLRELCDPVSPTEVLPPFLLIVHAR